MYAPEREATPEGFDARRLGWAIGKAGVNARAAGDTAQEAMRPVGDAFSKTAECARMVVPFVVPTLGIVSLIVFVPFLLPFMFGYADLSLLTSGVIGDIREVDVLQAFPLMLSLSYLVLTVEARVKDGGVSWREDEGAILFLRWASPVFVGVSLLLRAFSMWLREMVLVGGGVVDVSTAAVWRIEDLIVLASIIGVPLLVSTAVAALGSRYKKRNGKKPLLRKVANRCPVAHWVILMLLYMGSPIVLAAAMTGLMLIVFMVLLILAILLAAISVPVILFSGPRYFVEY